MNFKLTISLAVILLLAATLYYWAKSQPAPTTPVLGAASPLLGDKPKAIKSFSYIRDGELQVQFDKDGDNWKITKPIAASADSFSVGNTATTLQNMKYLRKFSPEASGGHSAKETGTDKPRDVVKFTDDSGKEFTLNVGLHSPDGPFATLSGDPTIYILQTDPIKSLDQKLDSFRNKQIKQIDTSKITKLQIKNGQDSVTLTKSGDKWLIDAPVHARANATAVQDIVTALGDIQALSFSTLDKKTASVDPPMASVTAWIEEPGATTTPAPATTTAASQSQPAVKTTEVTLQLGVFSDGLNRDTSSVYAGISGSPDVFVFSRDSYNKMKKELKDLRDAAVTPAAVAQATDMTLTTDGNVTIAASKNGNKWTMAAKPDPIGADPFSISDYLGVIRDLRAIKFVDNPGDLKSIGLDPPHMKIELTVPGQSQHEVLLVGNPETVDKVTPVQRQGEPTVYLLQTSDADKLVTSMIALRDKEVELLTADKIRKIDISGPLATSGIAPPAPAPATGTAPATAASAPATAPALPPGITLEREGTHWNAKKESKTWNGDDSKVSALLGDFTPLMAGKYTDDKPITGTPDITVAVTILESAMTQPATSTAPATLPAPAATMAGPATGTAPATTPATAPKLADLLPAGTNVSVDPGKLVTHTLRLYKQAAASQPAPASAPSTAPATVPATQPTTTWRAVWDGQTPTWTFEPESKLIDALTTNTYASETPATAPATTTAPAKP